MGVPFEFDNGPEKTDRFVFGYERAGKDYDAAADGESLVNPFPEESEEWKGWQEGMYDMTQK